MMSDNWFDIQNAPVKDLQKRKLKLIASRRIRDDSGLTIFSIEGTQQGGKSTYGMRILMDLYGNSQDDVLNHVVMSSKGFTDIVESAINGNYREKAIMWDDMSVGGSAATWVTDPLLVKYLAGLGDTLGIAAKALILTSPSGDMIKAFRNYNKYKVIIHNGRHKYDRIARGYKIGKSPMNQRWCSLEFEDHYDIRVPFYDIYAQRRKEISIEAVKNMKKMGEDKPEEKEHKVTIADKAREMYRDWQAGVFGDITFKNVCKVNKINYGYARAIV